MIHNILEYSIPMRTIILVIVAITLGRVWQFKITRAEMNRLIALVAELSHELSKYTTIEGSPLANAVKAYNESMRN